MCCGLDLCEIFEEFARLAMRIDARQWIARAVRVLAQEFIRREITARVLFQTPRVLAQTLDCFARQTMHEFQS